MRIHHIGLVVRDIEASFHFYRNVLGLRPHPSIDTWMLTGDHGAVHLIEIPEAEDGECLFRQIQHFAVEVESLPMMLKALLQGGSKPFQMDFEGNEHQINDPADPLDFGLRTLFVTDPDKNLIEFIGRNVGIHTPGGTF